MKKICTLLLGMALCGGLSAEQLTVKHAESGKFSEELKTALAEASLTKQQVTDLTVVSESEAEMNITDFNEVRTMAATLKTLDLSQAVLKGNGVPSTDNYSDRQGSLRDMTALVSVVLPEGITSIGGGAFARCANLETVNLPESVTTIWNAAFKDCKKLSINVLPSGLKVINKETFRGCAALSVAVLPEGLVTVDDYGFNGCKAMTVSLFPASLEKVGASAFASSGAMFSEWTDALVKIGDSAFSGSKVAFTEWTPNVETLPKGTFSYCYNIVDFTIPETVTALSNQLFVPTSYYYSAEGKNFKRTITCRHTVPPTAVCGSKSSSNTFFEEDWMLSKTYTLRVKKEYMDVYKATAPYKLMNVEALTTSLPVEIEGATATGSVVVTSELGEVVGGMLPVYEGKSEISIVPDKDMKIAQVLYGSEDVTENMVEGKLVLDFAQSPDLLSILLSDVSGVESLSVSGVAVCPNPVADVLKLSDNDGVARLYDLSGRIVVETSGCEMSVSHLENGVYVLQVNGESFKIVKN